MRDLSMHVLDIVQNSIKAGAKLIAVSFVRSPDGILTFTVKDDGCGMSPEFLARVTDPFTTTRTTRKVGLGIPMFKENAELTGGTFSIESTVGAGTKMRAGFVLSSIDRPPLGDLAATMISLVVSNPEFHFHLDYLVDGQSFSFDTEEIRAVLGPVPLDSPEVVSWMKDYLEEGIESLHGGA